MTAQHAFRFWFAFVLITLAGLAYGQVLNNEVEFGGTVSTVASNGEGGGTLFVDIGGFDLRVVVNAKTILQDSKTDEMEFDAIKTDAAVLISGKFSSSGVLATKVVLLQKDDPNLDTFEVSGHITSIQSDWKISLLGLVIQADSVLAANLKIGDWVRVEGTISGSTWKATSIKSVDPGKRKGNLTFEGEVKAWADGVLRVLPTGTTGDPTKVHVTSTTHVIGELTEGAYVSVTGKLVNFEVEAKRVEVLGALEIKPDERKLKVGETGEFTVKLRDVAPAGGVAVTIAISESNPPTGVVVTLSATSVTVPAGEQTAVFSVKAEAQGMATIKATAGDNSATALVKVGAVSEIDNERPTGGVRLAFAPDHIKMGPNETREVVLLVEPSQTERVEFAVDPVDAGIKVSEGRELGNGTAKLKVIIESLDKTKESAKVTATLGSAIAELLVDLSDKSHGKNK